MNTQISTYQPHYEQHSYLKEDQQNFINSTNSYLNLQCHQQPLIDNPSQKVLLQQISRISKKRKLLQYQSSNTTQDYTADYADWLTMQFKRLRYIDDSQSDRSQDQILLQSQCQYQQSQINSNYQQKATFLNIDNDVNESKAYQEVEQEQWTHICNDSTSEDNYDDIISQFQSQHTDSDTFYDDLNHDLIKVTRTNGHIDIEPYNKMLPFQAYSDKLTHILSIPKSLQNSNTLQQSRTKRRTLKYKSQQHVHLNNSVKKRYEYSYTQSHPLINDFDKFSISDIQANDQIMVLQQIQIKTQDQQQKQKSDVNMKPTHEAQCPQQIKIKYQNWTVSTLNQDIPKDLKCIQMR